VRLEEEIKKLKKDVNEYEESLPGEDQKLKDL
jgi:hypothetical protein